MKNLFSKFLTDELGATAIEYGLIAAGIAVAIISMVDLVGTNLIDHLQQHRRQSGRFGRYAVSEPVVNGTIPGPFAHNVTARRPPPRRPFASLKAR